MSSRWQAEKRAIADAYRRLGELGLTAGSSGNVSIRLDTSNSDGLVAITPSGRSYEDLGEEDVVVVDFDVEQVEGDLVPSSETLLHLEVYRRRPDAGAVIHTHALYSSVLAVAGIEIPPVIDEMVVSLGGGIQVSEYAFPGSEDLAENVCDALGDRAAALVRSHGAVGVGRDLREAMDVCVLVERVAHVFVNASLLGKVSALPADAVEAEKAIYRMRRQSAMK